MVEFPEFALRVIVALLLGLLVGIDREIKHKPLGARAYMLVSMGSAGFMLITLNFALGAVADNPDVSIDPSRLIQGLVGGIGFLGAGAIISGHSGGRLRGVGSGAAIWVVGGVGIACGLGHLLEAGLMAVLALAVLSVCDWCEAHHKAGFGEDEDKD